MEKYAVIMAGGVGARFWPLSRMKEPKQLLKIFDDHTMIQNTVDRLSNFIDSDKIFVVTNKIQRSSIINQLKNIPEENVIEEPFGKNTAACIGLASVIIESADPDSVVITLPADHLISPKEVYQDTINKAADFAYESRGLVTIGIPPTRPETGYGYIQINENQNGNEIYKVKTFAEKPNLATAERFLKSGDFLWNSGMFIWRVDSILDEINKYMPELYEGLCEIRKFVGKENFDENLNTVYGHLKNISIDYGIMEKSDNVYLIKGEFNWSDVGSWEEVYQLSEKDDNGNVINDDCYTADSFNNYVHSKGKFTAIIGADNLIIIDTPDALLICDRNKSQEVKHIVDHLKIHKRTELL